MAGIYIRGLEMPKVPTRFIIFADGRVEDEDDSAYKYSAVPVPDHGRLFDADALADRLEKDRTFILHSMMEAHKKFDGYTREDYLFDRNGDFISILRNQAAVIPADKKEEK